MLAHHAEAIQIWRPAPDFAQQSSEDIWQAIARAVRKVLSDAAVSPEQVRGIGFDATCSLVAVAGDGSPVSVSPDGEAEQNIILWMDHRATEDAAVINATRHEVLRYVGGQISPEMQAPKLRWLRKHLPSTWNRAAHFFDLPDYLTYRATGSLTRSLCSTVCKMTYLAHESGPNPDSIGRWDAGFFSLIGLEDLANEGFARLGTRVRPMGESIPGGLCAAAAADLSLLPGTPVGVSIIDAHAGALALLGISLPDSPTDFRRRLALIGGTSSCHLAVNPEPFYLPGIWGPYYSALIPGWWLNEGGQSATGALVDHIVFNHACSAELKESAEAAGCSVYAFLNQRADELERAAGSHAALLGDLHVCPYFHGNRSPRADPQLRGMISGLTLSSSLDDLVRLYLATLDAIALGTRHIIETMNKDGYAIERLHFAGGGTKNPRYLQAHADATGCEVVLPAEPEAVLLGAALLGCVASGLQPDLPTAMTQLCNPGQRIAPRASLADTYAKRYRAFHFLAEAQIAIRGDV